MGLFPTVKVPEIPPEICSLVTVSLPWFATQMLVPSKATPPGALPTTKVPW